MGFFEQKFLLKNQIVAEYQYFEGKNNMIIF